MKFAGKLNESLKNHFFNLKVYTGSSKTIQNKLLDGILEMCHAVIKQSNFLSVKSDYTTYVSGHTYEVNVGILVEKFFGSTHSHKQLIGGQWWN